MLYIGNTRYRVYSGRDRVSIESPKRQETIIKNTLLPSGLQLYDYIESTGTQWIDTGVYGYMNHSYELDFQQTDVGNYRTWGVFGQASYIGYNMSLTYGGSQWLIRWNYTSNENLIYLPIIDTNRHTLKIQNGVVYFDGVNKGTSTGHNSDFSINYNLYLFTINPANTTPTTNNKVKVFSYKDIDENGNLVRNMLPCTYFGEPGMWDTVEGKFYGNEGDGQFILGNKIILHEYEYLENVSNSYIDLDYVPTNTTGVKIEASPNKVKSAQILLGRGYSDNNTRWWLNFTSGNSLSFGWNTAYSTINPYYANTWYVIEHNYLNSRTNSVNDVVADSQYPNLTLTSDSISLFTNISYPSNYVFTGKVKYLYITEGDQIVRNFVPCTYNGIPGLWDKIELKFYGSSNNGTFIVSNKIKYYDYLEKDGVAYIDTGYIPTINTKIRYKFAPLLSNLIGYSGARLDPYRFSVTTFENGSYFTFALTNNTWSNNRTDIKLNKVYDCIAGNGYQIINNVEYSEEVLTEPIIWSKTFKTKAVGKDDSYNTSFDNQKIYIIQIWENDTLVRDFKPCLYNGVAGLWDSVEHKFYGNANSAGALTVGNDS